MDGADRYQQSIWPPCHFGIHRHGHILSEDCRRFCYVKLDVDCASLGIDAGVDIHQLGGEALLWIGIGSDQCILTKGQQAQVFIDFDNQLRTAGGESVINTLPA